MAYDRVNIWRLDAEATTGNFDEENAAPARIPQRVWGTSPTIIRSYVESPESVQGMYRRRKIKGRSTGEITIQKFLRPKGTGTTLKSNIWLTSLLGNTSDISAKNSIVSGVGGGPATTTTFDVVDTTFAATDIGKMIAVPCLDGKWYAREIRSIADDGGPDTITITPALPEIALVGASCRGMVNWYYTGSVGAVLQALQIVAQHEDDDHILLMLGCTPDGKIKFEPLSDMPFTTLDMTIKVADSDWDTPAALTDATDDNEEPLSLADGMEFLICPYAAGVRASTRTEVAVESFIWDMGNNLQAIPDGNSVANSVARWKNTRGENTLTGVVRMGWAKAWWTALEAATNYHLLCGWGGVALGTGIGVLYIPRIFLHDVKTVEVNGLELAEIAIAAGAVVDAGTANAVESAELKMAWLDT